jgi:hypothetical protein
VIKKLNKKKTETSETLEPIESKIETEYKRLKKLFKAIPELKLNALDGLLHEAAYQRIMLLEYEQDLIKNGYTELYTQSIKNPPYQRERVSARLQNNMNKNYQTTIKLLCNLLPEKDPKLKSDLSKFQADV